MQQKRHSIDQIIGKLRQADIEPGKGKKVPEVCKIPEINVQIVLPLATEVRPMQPAMAKQLKAFEKENSRLKKLGADQALDVEILRQAAKGNW